MTHFLNRNDIFETLARDKAEADAHIQPWQATLKKGDHFCYLSVEVGLVIWGEVLEDQTDPTMHGYRFCKCFSVVEPDGELGEVHISVINKSVTKSIFERARQAKWPHDEVTFTKFAAELVEARTSN